MATLVCVIHHVLDQAVPTGRVTRAVTNFYDYFQLVDILKGQKSHTNQHFTVDDVSWALSKKAPKMKLKSFSRLKIAYFKKETFYNSPSRNVEAIFDYM